ncbi:MAG: dehydrogenase (quinone), partial [Methermicoccus sp.]|nr:dehydrogenase (quinone) [Methermicoccus sp.]
MSQYKMHILVCGGTGCRSSQSGLISELFQDELLRKGLKNEVQVIRTGCFGFCEKGPIVKILPDNTFYTQVKPEDAVEIIDEHIIKGRKETRLLYLDPETQEYI